MNTAPLFGLITVADIKAFFVDQAELRGIMLVTLFDEIDKGISVNIHDEHSHQAFAYGKYGGGKPNCWLVRLG